MPITLFLYGAANVVVLSFVPAALFSDDHPSARPPAPAWLAGWPAGAAVAVLLGATAFAGLLATGAGAALPGGEPLAAALALAVAGVAVAGAARLTRVLAGRPDERDTSGEMAAAALPVALLYAVALALGIALPRVHTVLPVPPLRSDLIWYVQVTLLVLGHAAGVQLVHRWATARFPTRRRAVLAQYPMVVLLVAYTMTGMWVLGQAVVAM